VYFLRPRGYFHREAIRGARNEGEEHSVLLADTGAYLRARGIHLRVIRQGGGYLRPDGEFDRLGRTYNVEVECGTLAKHPKQTLANVRKAVADGRRCLVVVSDRRTAERAAAVLSTEGGPGELWGHVGLVWRSGREAFSLYEVAGRRPWGFLPGGADEPDEVGPPAEGGSAEIRFGGESSEVSRVRKAVASLLAAERRFATASDFSEFLTAGGDPPLDRRQLGMALRSLGIVARRTRSGGNEKARTYDLSPLAGQPSGRRAEL
jgi:hypothetical protein